MKYYDEMCKRADDYDRIASLLQEVQEENQKLNEQLNKVHDVIDETLYNISNQYQHQESLDIYLLKLREYIKGVVKDEI